MFELPPLAFCLPPFAIGIGAAALAVVVWIRRPSQPAAALALYLLSVAIWSIGYGLQLTSTTLAGQVLWSKVEYMGPSGVSLAGLVFVLQYCGLNEWVRASRILLLSVPLAVTQFLAWTNENHHLIWRRVWLVSRGSYVLMARTHGPGFWIFLIYGYALCSVAIFLLFRELFRRRGIYRSQVAILLVGCLVPFAGNAMFSFGFSPLPSLDFTVFGFSITGLSMAWGLFRFQLPVIMPIARQTVFEGMSDAAIALDLAGNVVEVNPAVSRMLGQPPSLFIGRSAVAAFKRYPDLAGFCAQPQEGHRPLTIETANLACRFDARRSLLKNGSQKVIGSLIVLRDVTDREAADEALRHAHSVLEQRIAERTADLSRTIDELRQLEDQLTFYASHDGLTELPNRRLFLDRVNRRLTDQRDASMFAVLYIDLDRFKVYNDGYGHHFGDLLLVEMSRRLQSCVRSSDTLARMGGDEFTILLNDVDNDAHASQIAQQCLQSLAAPGRIAGNDVHLTASIGVVAAICPNCPADELVRDADLAMYRAKRQGGNRAILFGQQMRSSALSQIQLEQDLRFAVARNELVVHYQPFVHMHTGQIVGFEALVRWQHPGRGLLQPSEFLPIAEQNGSLIAIDEFVLREACRQKEVWAASSDPREEHPFVSVNVAGWQFSNPQRWWQTLLALNTRVIGLRLEMVEGLLENTHAAADFFQQVRSCNLDIYLDDFGTGYSSLSRLSNFPIRSLKIDRSFVKDLNLGTRDLSIVKAIIALARSLDMEVVAEGIENPDQLEILRYLGCQFGQGFYFSQAVEGSAALAMLEQQRSRSVH